MYKKGLYTITSNMPLTETIYKMVLQGETSYISASGQFVEIELPNNFLRRPFSVCDYDDNSITLIYKIVGEGTQLMSQLKIGTTLDLITGLGNGFDINIDTKQPLLIGGGVGIPPLYNLAKQLIKKGLQTTVALGFNCAEELFFVKEFKEIGCKVVVATIDGSVGTKGYVTDAINQNGINCDYFFACGPLPMLKALCNHFTIEGQISMEERMGCGFGACMGCSIQTKNGAKRVCKEGPVFLKSELDL